MINESIQSVAVLRLGALGDVCLTVPLIRALQQHLPHTKIYWVISRPMYALVEGLSNVEFIVIDKPTSLRSYWRCYRQLKAYRFDALLVPQATWRTNLLCAFIRADAKYGYDPLHSRDGQRFFINRTVPAEPEHLLDSFLRFAEPFGIGDKRIDWSLPIDENDKQWAKQQLSIHSGKWLAVCPATSKAERNWLSDRYAATINELSRQWSFNVVLVGGKSEIEQQMAEAIESRLQTNCLNLVGKSSLKQLTALLGNVDVLLSPDTGPLHIATALQIPVVGLYAVAPPQKTGPYYSQQWVVNKFPDAVRNILKKDLAKVAWHDRVHSPKAMELITADEVKQKCDALFSELNFPGSPS